MLSDIIHVAAASFSPNFQRQAWRVDAEHVQDSQLTASARNTLSRLTTDLLPATNPSTGHPRNRVVATRQISSRHMTDFVARDRLQLVHPGHLRDRFYRHTTACRSSTRVSARQILSPHDRLCYRATVERATHRHQRIHTDLRDSTRHASAMAAKRMIEKLVAQMQDGSDPEKRLKETSLATLLELMTEDGVRFRGTTANTIEEVTGYLARVRDGLNLKNTEIAERTGISRSTVSAVLGGKAEKLRLDTLGKLANALSAALEFDALKNPPRMTCYSELTGGPPLTATLDSTPVYEELAQEINAILGDSYNPSVRGAADKWAKVVAESNEKMRRSTEKLREMSRDREVNQAMIEQQRAEIADLVHRARVREVELNNRYTSLLNQQKSEKSSFDKALEELNRTLAADQRRHDAEMRRLAQASRRDLWSAVLGTSAGIGGMMMFGDKLSPGWQATVGAAGVTMAGTTARYGAKDSATTTGAAFLGLGSLIGAAMLLAKKRLE